MFFIFRYLRIIYRITYIIYLYTFFIFCFYVKFITMFPENLIAFYKVFYYLLATNKFIYKNVFDT